MIQKISNSLSSDPFAIHIISALGMPLYLWILIEHNISNHLVSLLPCAFSLAVLQILHPNKMPTSGRWIWIITSGLLIYITSVVTTLLPIYVFFRFDSPPIHLILAEGLILSGIATTSITILIGLAQIQLNFVKNKKRWMMYLFYCYVLNPNLAAMISISGFYFLDFSYSSIYLCFVFIFGLAYSILTRIALITCLTSD
jgi:hypothetical protein